MCSETKKKYRRHCKTIILAAAQRAARFSVTASKTSPLWAELREDAIASKMESRTSGMITSEGDSSDFNHAAGVKSMGVLDCDSRV